jgi:sulfur-carrier protein
MQVEILYFANVREAVGRARERVDLPASVQTAGQLRSWLRERGGAWAEQLAETRAVRIAVNQIMVAAEAPLSGATEVAFFPPVTGG